MAIVDPWEARIIMQLKNTKDKKTLGLQRAVENWYKVSSVGLA